MPSRRKSRNAAKPTTRAPDAALLTPDRRYLVVRGRLWRAINPGLAKTKAKRWTSQLMAARRAVYAAMRAKDTEALRAARAAVHAAKLALGERGAVWWKDGSPDYNRHLAKNTPYAAWFEKKAKL
jgi:hypothetical protein